MIDIQLYDKHELQGKILIWHNNPTNSVISFRIMLQNNGEERMDVCNGGQYRPHFNDTFWKTDVDYPNLFLVKELFTDGMA